MVQVSEHIINLDNAVPDLEPVRLAIADLLYVLRRGDRSVIEVHPCCHVLYVVHYFAFCRPHKVGVVRFVASEVLLVEVFRVGHGHDQIN